MKSKFCHECKPKVSIEMRPCNGDTMHVVITYKVAHKTWNIEFHNNIVRIKLLYCSVKVHDSQSVVARKASLYSCIAGHNLFISLVLGWF